MAALFSRAFDPSYIFLSFNIRPEKIRIAAF